VLEEAMREEVGDIGEYVREQLKAANKTESGRYK
jgi:hypothetical protein